MPSYEDVTEPILLDETGQDIVEALQELKAVVQPTNVCVDLDVSLEVSGWSNSAPYVYNWMNNKVTTECAVKVNFLEDSAETDQLYISYEKIVGGVQFEAETKPTSAIPVRIHIVNAEADSITSITDEMVSTSVIPNASNVKQALTVLNNAIICSTTDEVLCGKWDNKPLYRKCFSIPIDDKTSTALIINAELPYAEFIKRISGTYNYRPSQNDDIETCVVPATFKSDVHDQWMLGLANFRKTRFNFHRGTGWFSYTDCTLNVIIEYTKS